MAAPGGACTYYEKYYTNICRKKKKLLLNRVFKLLHFIH